MAEVLPLRLIDSHMDQVDILVTNGMQLVFAKRVHLLNQK